MRFFVRYDVNAPIRGTGLESEKVEDLEKALFDLKDISTFDRVANARLVAEEEFGSPEDLKKGTLLGHHTQVFWLLERQAGSYRQQAEKLAGEVADFTHYAKNAIPEAEHPKEETAHNWAWQVGQLGEDRRAAYRKIERLELELASSKRETECMRNQSIEFHGRLGRTEQENVRLKEDNKKLEAQVAGQQANYLRLADEAGKLAAQVRDRDTLLKNENENYRRVNEELEFTKKMLARCAPAADKVDRYNEVQRELEAAKKQIASLEATLRNERTARDPKVRAKTFEEALVDVREAFKDVRDGLAVKRKIPVHQSGRTFFVEVGEAPKPQGFDPDWAKKRVDF